MTFDTRTLATAPQVDAPDGSRVHILCQGGRGSMAQFVLAPGACAKAVAHRTVEEIWFVLAGKGRIWRALAGREETTELRPGLSLTLPLGTHFQFRNDGTEDLKILGITQPPWPGEEEAYFVDGPWPECDGPDRD